jgi:hypothetical protein
VEAGLAEDDADLQEAKHRRCKTLGSEAPERSHRLAAAPRRTGVAAGGRIRVGAGDALRFTLPAGAAEVRFMGRTAPE